MIRAALLAGLALLSGCASTWERYPTEVRMWAAWDTNDGDARSPIGRQPTGNIMLTQPLPAYLELSYQHISSIQDFRDRGTIDQFGVGFCVKVPLRDCR